MPTILIVDDAADNLEFLERSLKRLGYEVLSANSGADAFGVAEAQHPDVILLDVLMPNLDGIEVCRRLKDIPTLAPIPVIMVSASAQEDHVVRALDAGAVDYVTRPFNDAVLAARVRSALRMKEANDTVLGMARLGSDFLATTSHELRTPLTNILEFANSLLEPARSEDERRAAINSIRCSGDHLLQIVDDIRDLSEIQAGRLEVETVACSPVNIVAEVASLIRRHSGDRGLDLKLDYAGPIPETIHSDPARLRQILLNLLSSAVKFSRGGSLEVRTEFLPRDSDESWLQFEIVDPGSGMCDQELPKLFRPYGQVDASTTTGLGSAALGLAISNQLAECLGGDMSVAYSPAKGCRVRVRVPTGGLEGVALLDQPVAASVVGAEDPPFPECVGRLGECRILLAEDDPVIRKSISDLLTRAGAEVTIAVTGPAGVGLAMAADAAGSPFDIVLMETHLSVLDGDGAIELLRERGYGQPIIGISEPAAAERQERCGPSGSDDVIVKPIDPSRLMAAIRAQLTMRAVPERAQPTPS